MILDLRLNMLDKFVSYFVICEAKFNHNGSKRELKFDIKKFSKFKSKIIYLPLYFQPNNIKAINDMDSQLIKNSKILDNALLRENFQRNYLQNKIKDFQDDDLIIISDVDEIPNLENFDLKQSKKKLIIFNQIMFYYKFNLSLPNLDWFGSKACRIKDLKSIDLLRSSKSKIYPFYRIDTLFSNIKHQSVEIVDNGGWHFSNLKNIFCH